MVRQVGARGASRLVPKKTGGKHPWPVEDTQMNEAQVLPDKPMVKRAGVNIDPTPEQIAELGRCMYDPIYFIKTYCRIMTLDYGLQPFELFGFQEDLIQMYVNNRFSIACTGRQLGKCVTGDTKIKVRINRTVYEMKTSEFHAWARFYAQVMADFPGQFKSESDQDGPQS